MPRWVDLLTTCSVADCVPSGGDGADLEPNHMAGSSGAAAAQQCISRRGHDPWLTGGLTGGQRAGPDAALTSSEDATAPGCIATSSMGVAGPASTLTCSEDKPGPDGAPASGMDTAGPDSTATSNSGGKGTSVMLPPNSGWPSADQADLHGKRGVGVASLPHAVEGHGWGQRRCRPGTNPSYQTHYQ